MKRFYKEVATIADGQGYAIRLDGRPVKTPARNGLIIPTKALADVIVAEWDAQNEEIDAETMPMNALAQGALDQVEHERERIIARIAAFADSDMLYFRAEETQQALIDHQAEHWDPLLDWARSRYDVSFILVHGIMHQSQPDETIERLTAAVEAQDDFTIAAMLSLVGLAGSLVATLGLVEEVFDTKTLWPLMNLEELWQEKQWGQDELAVAKRMKKQAEFEAAARFLKLARS